jgi:chromosome condensin MukBEF ATPase and DNA-binding subunit MukB
MLLKFYVDRRKLNLADRKLKVESGALERDAYSQEVRLLRDELRTERAAQRAEVEQLKKSHREDMEEMSRRNEECDRDREALRDKVEALREYADGLYRVILQNSAAGVLQLGDFPTEEIKRAAERVDSLFREAKRGNPS